MSILEWNTHSSLGGGHLWCCSKETFQLSLNRTGSTSCFKKKEVNFFAPHLFLSCNPFLILFMSSTVLLSFSNFLIYPLLICLTQLFLERKAFDIGKFTKVSKLIRTNGEPFWGLKKKIISNSYSPKWREAIGGFLTNCSTTSHQYWLTKVTIDILVYTQTLS